MATHAVIRGMIACMAEVGGACGANPLQVAIHSCEYVGKEGALPVHDCSRATPTALVSLHLIGALVMGWPLLHECGLIALLAC